MIRRPSVYLVGVLVVVATVTGILLHGEKTKAKSLSSALQDATAEKEALRAENEQLTAQLKNSAKLATAERNELLGYRNSVPILRRQTNELSQALEKAHRDISVALGQSQDTKRLPMDASMLPENSPIPSATLAARAPDPAMLTTAYDHARLNNLEALKAALDENPDFINQPVGVRGSTLLHSAAYNGHQRIIDELLRRGSTVNQRNFAGETALYSAVLRGTPEGIQALLAAGADPKIADNNGLTPLKMAIVRGRDEIAGILTKFGAQE